tara:strand:+ start:39 stop:257 length:219 start_codon:yes stop_codon:yes gene_type:complete
MRKFFRSFTDHPHSISETYLEHMIAAGYYGFKMVFAGLACIIHAIFPFLFESAASDCAKDINKAVESRKQRH